MPPTVVTEDPDRAERAIRRFGKAVLKPLYSTKARGMVTVEAGGDVAGEIERFREAGNSIFYIQKMVSLPDRDMGVAFLGGRYLGTYARVRGEGSWNTTTSAGGSYEGCDPPQDIIELARKAQQPFDLDFTCVDVAECPDGPVVFEVSAFGGFRGLLEGCGLDAARHLTDHVLESMGHE
jgi:ribosomal protein S6--L-glutamate ligase